MKRALRNLQRFWFAPIAAGPLGTLRIAVGALLVLWGLLMRPGLSTWYSEQGMFPLSAMRQFNGPGPFINLLDRVTDLRVVTALYVAFLLAAFFMTIGLQTRIASAATFVLLASLHHRNIAILHGGDSVMRILCLYLAVAPSGADLSVDRLLRIRRGKERADCPALIEAWSLRLIQIQIWVIYAATFLSKIGGSTWQNGTAVYYPLHLADLQRFPLPFSTENVLIINLLTYGTLAVEGALMLFLWTPRLRYFALAGGVLMHLGIAYALNIPLFSLIMIASYLAFVPNEWLTGLRAQLRNLTGRARPLNRDGRADA